MSQRPNKKEGKGSSSGTDDALPQPKQFFQWVALTTPPLSPKARSRVGFLLRLLQQGEKLDEPEWKPLTKSIGPGCGELRVRDDKIWWRVVCYVDARNLVVLELFHKQTDETPEDVKKLCRTRLRETLATLKS